MPASATERSLIASVAAHTRWATTASDAERSAATAPARTGLDARFAREVDPDGRLTDDERARAVANARSAHFRRLRAKGLAAQRRKAAAVAEAAEAARIDRETEMRGGVA